MDVHVYAACTSGRADDDLDACVEFYRTASELSHVDVYSEEKRAAVSRVHAVVVYRVQKRVNTNVAAARWTDFVPKPRGRPDGVRHSSTWTSMGLVTRAHGRRPGPRALRPRGHHPPAA